MVDLSTSYLGMRLKNPLVPSASPLSRDLATAKRLEDAGASAIVMYSLFEEELREEEAQLDRFVEHQALGHAEAQTFFPQTPGYAGYLDRYLEQIASLKTALDIPVIASLNGVSPNGWVEHGRDLQDAGADALELNVYYVAASSEYSSGDVEEMYVELLSELKRHVSIPITMKLSSQFTSVMYLVKLLEEAGADGVSLFNRFYQPDIDLETLAITPRLSLSNSSESLLRVRWVAILYGRVQLSLAVTGGIHTAQDALKALLAGADVTQLCSALLKHGPERLAEILADMRAWLVEHEYDSVAQLKGSVSQQHASDPAVYERANYVHVLDSYTGPAGVRR